MKTIRTLSTCSFLLAGSLFASSLQEQNKAVAKSAFEEILSNGHFELADQLYARDFVNHGVRHDASLEEDQAALKGWHQAFSDVVVEPRKLIAEGDLVTVYWVARGTNTGTGNGLPASRIGWHHHLANRRWKDQRRMVRLRSAFNDAPTWPFTARNQMNDRI
jgi:predicted SnoaL-like aldol condensation-catalyzing enzyme